MGQFRGQTPTPVLLQGMKTDESDTEVINVTGGSVHVTLEGGGTVSSPTTKGSVDVDETADLLAAANADRKEIQFQNVGDEDIYIGFDASVVATDSQNANGGIRLLPGGSYSRTGVYTGAYYGICGSGLSSVVVVEEF